MIRKILKAFINSCQPQPIYEVEGEFMRELQDNLYAMETDEEKLNYIIDMIEEEI